MSKQLCFLISFVLVLSAASQGFCEDPIILDDFDSYTSSGDLRDVWKDYFTQDPPWTSSQVYVETVIVRDGNSMRYRYRNNLEPYYSEAQADTADLGIDPNWLGMGAKTLTLWFYGETYNDANEQMYIKLIDGYDESATVLYGGDMNNIREEEWHKWNILLHAFEVNNPSIDLRDVAQIIIGFGDEDYIYSDEGTVYFDDIYLSSTMQFYVDSSATGANNGTSWADAYNYLQDALDAAEANCSIWVAEGIYRPDEDNDHQGGTGYREVTFQLKDGVAIYGGFPIGGGAWESRNPGIYETVLSGDLDNNDDGFLYNDENSYHVVRGSGTDSNAILDGFTITAGNADHFFDPYYYCGSGMLNISGSPTVANCIFNWNSGTIGGGMYNQGSSPTVTTCTFSGNLADNDGGGMVNDSNSNPVVTNCTFISNDANNGGGMYNYSCAPTIKNCTYSGNFAVIGGGIYSDNGSPAVTNCKFWDNSASINGGGMYNRLSIDLALSNCIFCENEADSGGGVYNDGASMVTITNCTFNGNSADVNGGGIYNNDSNAVLTNCILWGDTAIASGNEIYNEGNSSITIEYCDVQGSWPGTGNINTDPLLADPAKGDYHLSHGSPCLNTGDPCYLPGPGETDYEGNPRVARGRIDIGAYEHEFGSTIIFVDINATGDNNGSSWDNAYRYLQDALTAAEPDQEIWVAQGIYRPDEDTNNPDGTDDRTAAFQLKNIVGVYGGFPNGGGLWKNRDPNIYETVLSGDIGTGDVNDNCYHVFYHPNGMNLDETAILDGFTITGGNADGNENYSWVGGGMFNQNNNPTVINCKFIGNLADTLGGGIMNGGGSPTLINCIFSENSAYGGDYGSGGGLANMGCNPIVVNCKFFGNSATRYGGGMINYNNTNTTITNCVFLGNSAGYSGGGIYDYNDSNPTVTNCSFIGNMASQGAGMFGDESNSVVINCIFNGNSATIAGGGMSNWYDSNPTIINCTFIENLAGSVGGGVSNHQSSNPTLTNCTFSGNSADNEGGGMFNITYCNPTITNCIFWCDTATDGNEIYNISSSPVVTYSDVQGGTGESWFGTGCIDDDPCFVDSLAGDLHLLPDSLCIDAGDPGGVYDGQTDIDGDPRVSDGRVDMGSDEVIWDGAEDIAPEDPLLILNPGGGSNDPKIDALVVFDNNSSGSGSITVVEMNTNPHPPTGGFSAFGKILRINTSLSDGEFFMTVVIPINADDLSDVEPSDVFLMYYDGGVCLLAVTANTKTPPAGNHHPDIDTAEPSLAAMSAYGLGHHGVYWNSYTEQGFVWANVDHCTDFSAAARGLPDFEPDGDVDLADFSEFALNWLDNGCGICGGADFTGDGNVDYYDLKEFADNWLAGK